MTDLDARVAALMSKIVNYRYVPIEAVDEKREALEAAIRAELQKPALHEPVTDAEVRAMLQQFETCYTKMPTHAAIRRSIESFLQGRAKPAQEEVPSLTNSPWFGCGECDVSFKCHGGESGCIRASKGEKT